MIRNRLLTILVLTFIFCGMLWGQAGFQYVKIKNENLRDAPGGSKIGEIQGGTKVEVLEKRPGWVKVQITAWIWEESLTSDLTLVEGFTLSASHILLKTEAEAQTVLKKLKSGSGFDEMARQFSADKASAAKGGVLGSFKRGDLVPEFEKVALALKAGEISAVVKTSLGYHIIRRDQ